MSVDEHYFTSGETTLDRDELACRLAEVAMGLKRPKGETATETMDMSERVCLRLGFDPKFRAMADAALAYLVERMTAGQGTPQ